MDKAQAADGGDDVDVAAEDGFILQFFKDGVELVLLLFGKGEDDVLCILEFRVEIEEFCAQLSLKRKKAGDQSRPYVGGATMQSKPLQK